MDMEITRADGETLLLSKAGVQVDDFNPLSIELDPTYEVIPGVHGELMVERCTVPVRFECQFIS